MAGSLASDPRKIKARRLFCGGEYHGQIGNPGLDPAIRRWLGDSRGHWEADTLVVETTNFTDKVSVRGSDEHMRLVERFTRVDDDTLHYEFTVDDPTAFSGAWTALLPMTRTGDRVFEYACHEGNYALPNILRGARADQSDEQ